MKLSRFFSAIGLVLLSIGSVGCGDGRPTRVPVSGTVLIDGQPLKYGYVRFVPSGARASGGKIDENGRFTLVCFDSEDGAVPGKHRVEVNACQPLSATKAKWHAPKRYADYMTSDLTLDVTGATSNAVINLTGDDGKPFAPFVEVQDAIGR